jgi:protein O-mannosyl-transferase
MRLGEVRNVAACLLIFAAVVALYYPVISHPFTDYDDDSYVTQNTHIREGITWNTIRWAFESSDNANWHPLAWISHALDIEFFGLQPSGHHATSLVLHGLNSVVLFLLAFFATKRFGPSLVLALLFAVHPINVESVAWVAERKNVLSSFFFLLTLGAYGWYQRSPHWTHYAVVVIFFICGLMAKPMLVTLPFVLLLVDYWPLERMEDKGSFWKLAREKIPLFALSFASCVVTFEVQKAGRAFHPATQFPLDVRFENAIVAYALYLWKMVWPAKLAVFYPHPGPAIGLWKVISSGFVLAVITSLTLTFRRQKYLMTGWLWFLGTLVPVIGIVQVGDQAMADRYAYIPLLGLFIMATWASADFFQSQKSSCAVSVAMAVVALLAYSFVSIRQIGYWSSNLDLWSHALTVTTNNPLAHRKIGWNLMASNDPAEALTHFREAVEINSNDPTNHVNLGLCLDANHQRDAAIVEYRKAISLASDPEQLASAYTDLGADLDGAGDDSEAHDSYNRALQFNPKLFNAYFDRGLLLEKEGQTEEAVQDYQRAVELQPTVQGFLQLSGALQKLNRIAEARTYYERARKLASVSNATQ